MESYEAPQNKKGKGVEANFNEASTLMSNLDLFNEANTSMANLDLSDFYLDGGENRKDHEDV